MTIRRPADVVGSLGEQIRPWMVPMTLAALLIIVDQVAQIWVSLGGFDFSVPLSRFQAAVLFAGRIAALAIAMLLIMFASQGSLHRGWVKVQGGVALVLAIALGVSLSVLWVDGPQVKTAVPGDQIPGFMSQWIRGLVVSMVGAVGFAALGVRLLTAR